MFVGIHRNFASQKSLFSRAQRIQVSNSNLFIDVCAFPFTKKNPLHWTFQSCFSQSLLSMVDTYVICYTRPLGRKRYMMWYFFFLYQPLLVLNIQNISNVSSIQLLFANKLKEPKLIISLHARKLNVAMCSCYCS